METIILTEISAIFVGMAALWKYLTMRLSKNEIEKIYDDVKTVVDYYKSATEDGTLSVDEKLELSEKTVAMVDDILKSLESEEK